MKRKKNEYIKNTEKQPKSDIPVQIQKKGVYHVAFLLNSDELDDCLCWLFVDFLYKLIKSIFGR